MDSAASFIGMGIPGLQEIIVILFILGIPVIITAVVLVVCLRKKSPPLPPASNQRDQDNSE